VDENFLELYRRSSDWAASKVTGAASRLEAATPCDEWNVRTLMNHVVETQNYFSHVAAGEKASPPSPTPPELVGDDPVGSFERAREGVLDAYEKPGIIETSGPTLGIASSDLLLHAWDLAKATGQDTAMPEGLADSAYGIIHGRFSEEQRMGVFKPEIEVAPDASGQERLLAYTGRDPHR
jgi:uncharacterized protein (TIGR03086 family)